MSNPEEKPAIELNTGSLPAQTVTVVPSHEREGAMGLRSLTVGRYEQIRRRRQASVTASESVEVDYAGDTFEWIDLKTGEIRKAYVFVAGLGFSQLLFAWASEDMKRRST